MDCRIDGMTCRRYTAKAAPPTLVHSGDSQRRPQLSRPLWGSFSPESATGVSSVTAPS